MVTTAVWTTQGQRSDGHHGQATDSYCPTMLVRRPAIKHTIPMWNSVVAVE